MNYREAALKCFGEGYDAAYESFRGILAPCPYEEDSYEYHAWQCGYHWYLAEVH